MAISSKQIGLEPQILCQTLCLLYQGIHWSYYWTDIYSEFYLKFILTSRYPKKTQLMWKSVRAYLKSLILILSFYKTKLHAIYIIQKHTLFMWFIKRVWFWAHSSIGTCHILTLSTSQCTRKTMLATRACIFVTFCTVIAFDKFQERCRSRILLQSIQPYTLSDQ